jgi:hypothetical protein
LRSLLPIKLMEDPEDLNSIGYLQDNFVMEKN